MSLADYAHHNEEAPRIWWEEEGKHAEFDRENDEVERHDAEDAFFEEMSEWDNPYLLSQLADRRYCERWPQAEKAMKWEARDRGLI